MPTNVPPTITGKVATKRWLAAVLLLCLALGGMAVLRSCSSSKDIRVLTGGFPQQTSQPWPQWRKTAWTYFQRLKASVFGPDQSVLVTAALLDIKLSAEALASRFSLGEPDFTDTNGMRVWIVPKARLNDLRSRAESIPGIELISSPRVQTGVGRHAQLQVLSTVFVNGTPSYVGVVWDIIPELRGRSIDLTTMFSLTEVLTNWPSASVSSDRAILSIATNVFPATQIRLGEGASVFILQEHGDSRKMKGIILSADASSK